MDRIRGRAWKFGDAVNTDVIYPGKYLPLTDPKEMALHAFEGVRPEFAKAVKPGDVLVAGRYFGCGSSREQAATCLKALGLGAVIAESFARIYYRNAINLGLPISVCPGISKGIEEGQELEVDLASGTIKNLASGESFQAQPLPPFVLEILEAGGLIPYLKGRLRSTRSRA
ncbi:MAG: 3-isopropylmalate dehydratase small subunit [Candidatus Acetothermia bacterium]|jgi:3-isopropylmalate/(R)-2-methylmalate dehydratase small subunit|nr:3-isopropylmalate dehydratase small subunit [Candidatus Acetothermia bacterium]MDH7504594.1 3-isopropylmalate dehydratase small subunit [Candidatus Acetothermia bacterium]